MKREIHGIAEKIIRHYRGEFPPFVPPRGTPRWITRDRLRQARALWRRRNDGKTLVAFGKRIRRIRRALKKSQSQFASLIGVSEITVRRWERGYGNLPATYCKYGQRIASMTRIENLERMITDFKKQGIPLEV